MSAKKKLSKLMVLPWGLVSPSYELAGAGRMAHLADLVLSTDIPLWILRERLTVLQEVRQFPQCLWIEISAAVLARVEDITGVVRVRHDTCPAERTSEALDTDDGE